MPEAVVPPVGRNAIAPATSDEIFLLIEKLVDLHKKGVLTDSEYELKKGDLLSRLYSLTLHISKATSVTRKAKEGNWSLVTPEEPCDNFCDAPTILG